MEFLKLKACCVSMNVENSLATLSLSKKSNLVLPFIGIHPECANDDLEKITNLIELNQNNISGVGEIGLDPTYCKNNDDTKRQIQVFESLLSSAEKFHKPVSIHSRKSLDDIFEIMTSYDTQHALLHWFDGSKKQLQKAMDMGFFVFSSSKDDISSNVFSRIFEALKMTLGIKLICAYFISKHRENLTGPSVSTSIFDSSALDNKVCLSLA